MIEHPPALGRRARSMRDKRQRIVAAATSLFATHGFAGTTTQQIAAEADVAAGTLFRYAATKGELFLMVYNHELARSVSFGWEEADRAAARGEDVSDCIATAAAALYREASSAMDAHVYQASCCSVTRTSPTGLRAWRSCSSSRPRSHAASARAWNPRGRATRRP